MRVLRVMPNGPEHLLLIAKCVTRVRLLQLDATTREVELEVLAERDDPSIDVTDLRRIARFDPLIEASAGVSRVAASGAMTRELFV